MIHFIRPACLWLSVPTLLYLSWVIYLKQQYNPWKNVCDPHLLTSITESTGRKSRSLFYFSLFLFYVISIFAISGPSWQKKALPVYHDANTLMLVLDLSPNMNETDLKPNRLLRAKYKIRDLINDSQHSQMGLVVFSEVAFTASPLSQDANTLNALLDELSPEMMPVSGSDSGAGLDEGYKLLKQAAKSHGNLLLITSSNPTGHSFRAAKTIIDSGAHLHILAMLDNNSVNTTTIANLEQLAKMGGGRLHLFTKDASDIQNILNSLRNKQVIKHEQTENAYLWLDAGPWFCLLLIPIGLLLLREHHRYEKR